MLDQRTYLLYHGYFCKAIWGSSLQLACGRWQALRQGQNPLLAGGFGQTGFFGKLLPVPRLQFAEAVFAANFHGHFRRELGIDRSAEQVIKRCQHGSAVAV